MQSYSDYKEQRGRLWSYPGITGRWNTCHSVLCHQQEQIGSQSPTNRKEIVCIHKVSSPHFVGEMDYELKKGGFMYLHEKSLKLSPNFHFISHIFGSHFHTLILWVFHLAIVFSNHDAGKYYEVGYCSAGAFDKGHVALVMILPAIQKPQECSYWKATRCAYI